MRTASSAQGAHAASSLEDVTFVQELDAIIQRVSEHKQEFANLKPSARLNILYEVRSRLLDQPTRLAEAVVKIKGLEGNEAAVPEQVIGINLIILTAVDTLIKTLSQLSKTGKVAPLTAQTRSNGQTALRVFPTSIWERYTNAFAASGVVSDVYVVKGKPATQGRTYSDEKGSHKGKLAAVLGAGNVGFLSIIDVLNMVFVEGCVVVCKYHPLQRDFALIADTLLLPLKERGYYTGIMTDIQLTRHLVYSPAVDHVHLTGGIATHDLLVWGPKEEQEKRKAENNPVLKTPITSELGCVTPWLIVPGPWTKDQLLHHARQLAQAVADNTSCNCLAAKVVFLAKEWALTDRFIELFKREMSHCKLPPAWYPGMRDRYNAFTSQYPSSEIIHTPPQEGKNDYGEPLPWRINILDDLPKESEDEYALSVEPFAPVLTIVKAAVGSAADQKQLPVEYLKKMVPYVNANVWGNLSCSIFVHPDVHREEEAAVEAALDTLEYGSVNLNAWSVTGYVPMNGYWGAYAGDQTLQAVGSGLGQINNSNLIDYPEKAVVCTPFVSGIHPMPPHVSPIPMWVAKLILGLTYNGLSGIVKMMLFAH